MIATNIAYFSNLKPDFDPEELCRTLHLGATQEEVVQDVIVHGNQAAFVVFSDHVFVDLVVKHYHGKSFLCSVVSVTGLTKELEQILIQLRPGGDIPQLQEVKSTQSGKPSSQSKVSDVMAAISGLNSDEKLQIKAGLFGMTTDIGVKDTYAGSKAFGLPKKVESQKVVISPPVLHEPQLNQLSGIAPLPASTPHLDQTFHFGNSNTVHNIWVTTFSGSGKDCSFEQFRYDVQCLVNQGQSIFVL